MTWTIVKGTRDKTEHAGRGADPCSLPLKALREEAQAMRRGGAEIIRRLPDGGTVEAFYGDMVDEDCWFVVRFDRDHYQLDKEGETYYKKEDAAKAVSRRVRQIKNGEEFSAEELRTGHAIF